MKDTFNGTRMDDREKEKVLPRQSQRTAIAALLVIALASSVTGCSRQQEAEAPKASAPASQVASSVEVKRTYPPLEFKGAQLGASYEAAAGALAALDPECAAKLKKIKDNALCRIWSGTYAKEPVEKTEISLYKGAFQSVYLLTKPESFDKIAATLEERYGPPTSASEAPMSNAFGAKFLNRYLRWDTSDGGRIFGMKYVNDISTSVITLSSASVAKAEDERAKAAKPRKDDL